MRALKICSLCYFCISKYQIVAYFGRFYVEWELNLNKSTKLFLFKRHCPESRRHFETFQNFEVLDYQASVLFDKNFVENAIVKISRKIQMFSDCAYHGITIISLLRILFSTRLICHSRYFTYRPS
jgi:hypothetical protein